MRPNLFGRRRSRDRLLNHRGSGTIVLVAIIIATTLLTTLIFLESGRSRQNMSTNYMDALTSQHRLESGFEIQLNRLERAVEGFTLSGKLPLVTDGQAPASEAYGDIVTRYGADADGAALFLKHVVESQAINDEGSVISGHEFESFANAFPTTWADPNPNDNEYFERRWTFNPQAPVFTSNPVQQISFEYGYTIEVRAYGDVKFSASSALHQGTFSILLSTAPFSQYALFRDQHKNQTGLILVFAGGNTSAQVQEVFAGPVHTNSEPYFYGHPIFKELFSSIAAIADWWEGQDADYTCCATFEENKVGLTAPIILPTEMGNLVRLAAGDSSPDADSNTAAVSEAELVTMLSTHALGSLPGGTATVPAGIYIPTDGGSPATPTGGIYVEGDARIELNVVSGSSDFGGSYWSNIDPTHQGCKFQKISVVLPDGSADPRDVFVGDEPCDVTYVFDFNNPSAAPVVLNGRINGNVYVDGAIDEIGGESRTRPALVEDFTYTFAALEDVRIKNDIQYEDAQYVSLEADGTMGSTVVATPTGEFGGSGIEPTDSDLAAVMDEESQTILGIVSVKRSVYVHQNAPANLNLHAAVYAGNSEAYDPVTGLGCGTAGVDTQGCGFGYEGWDYQTGMGTLKMLGSMSEYRSQTVGRLYATPTGYSRRFAYDTRLLQSVTPPAFPISSRLQAFPTFGTFRSWRISQAD